MSDPEISNQISSEDIIQEEDIISEEPQQHDTNMHLTFLPIDLLQLPLKSKNLTFLPSLIKNYMAYDTPCENLNFASQQFSVNSDPEEIVSDYTETSTIYTYTQNLEHHVKQLPQIYNQVKKKIDNSNTHSHKDDIQRALLQAEQQKVLEQQMKQKQEEKEQREREKQKQKELKKIKSQQILIQQQNLEKEKQEKEKIEKEEKPFKSVSDFKIIANEDNDSSSSLLDCDKLRKMNRMQKNKGAKYQRNKTTSQSDINFSSTTLNKKQGKQSKKYSSRLQQQQNDLNEQIRSVDSINFSTSDNRNESLKAKLRQKKQLEENNDIDFEILDDEIEEEQTNKKPMNPIPIIKRFKEDDEQQQSSTQLTTTSRTKGVQKPRIYTYDYFFKQSHIPYEGEDSEGYRIAFKRIFDNIRDYDSKQKQAFLQYFSFQDSLNFTKLGSGYQSEIPKYVGGQMTEDRLRIQKSLLLRKKLSKDKLQDDQYKIMEDRMKKWFGNTVNQEDICKTLHRGDYNLKSSYDFLIENASHFKSVFKMRQDQLQSRRKPTRAQRSRANLNNQD